MAVSAKAKNNAGKTAGDTVEKTAEADAAQDIAAQDNAAQDNAGNIEYLIEHVRKSRNGDVTLTEIIDLAGVTVSSMQGFAEAANGGAYRELCDIAAYIAEARAELGALQANELKNERIPAAGKELDAIVSATEAATHTIMEQAETIMNADPYNITAYQSTMNDAVMRIFEACSFQDITGQRVAKVVETFEVIDERLSRFIKTVGMADALGALSDRETAGQARKSALILNGPQLDGDGNAQEEIDALFDTSGAAGKAGA